jgi:translation initiation factor 6 (eIF-6)
MAPSRPGIRVASDSGLSANPKSGRMSKHERLDEEFEMSLSRGTVNFGGIVEAGVTVAGLYPAESRDERRDRTSDVNG